MANKKRSNKSRKKSTSKNKTWLIAGITVAVLVVLGLVLYSPVKEVLFGKAIIYPQITPSLEPTLYPRPSYTLPTPTPTPVPTPVCPSPTTDDSAWVIDNFDLLNPEDPFCYASDDEPQNHGWIRLTGEGEMSRELEILVDDNNPCIETINHYLKTETTYASDAGATDQLKYAVSMFLGDYMAPEDTTNYYNIRFNIADRNLYYVEIYVRAINDQSETRNFFLRYVPEDPADPNKPFMVSGQYITHYLGSEYMDPNGCQVERNLQNDIHDALVAEFGAQVQYDYYQVLGVVLRGDIDKFDNLELAT